MSGDIAVVTAAVPAAAVDNCHDLPDEQVPPVAVPSRFTLFLVTRRPPPPALAPAADGLADRLGLEPPSDGW